MEEKKAGEKFPEYDKSDTVLSPKEQLLSAQKRSSNFKEQVIKSMAMFFVVAACILFYFALLRLSEISYAVKSFLSVAKPIIYGLAIAYLLNPIVKVIDSKLVPFFEKKCPKMKRKETFSRGVGILVSLVLLVAVIVALLNMMIPQLYTSIRDMIVNVPSQMNRFVKAFNEMHSSDSTVGKILENVMKEATTFIQNWMRTDLMDKVNEWMTQLTAGVILMVREILNFIIGMIVSIYVLFSKEKFMCQAKKLVYAIFRPTKANLILHVGSKSNEIFGGFIIGKIIDSAIIGVLCFIGLSILNIPYTLLVSVIVGVKGVYFVIFIILLQQFDGNILGPKILGNSTGLSAFWVVFSILIAGGLFGIPGMLLGVPTFAVIYYIISMVVNRKLRKKQLPTDTDSYDEQGYVQADGSYVHMEENILKEKGDEPYADSSTK